MTTTVHELTIAEASDLVRDRVLSPVDLTRALIDRMAVVDPSLNAFVTATPERALQDARRAEAEIARGEWRGAMHGIPYGVKDVYDTAGIATTAHSKVARDNVPSADSAVVQRLQAAGGVLMGKLATYQFTHGGPSFDPPWPPARNPWNTAHDAGGSSSGSAAAVAAGLVLGAMGTDTGGSVRIPASFCGLAGFKPTSGLVSRRGVIPNSWSFDHCGPIARTVADCAILLQAVAGFDPLDPSSEPCSPANFRELLGRSLKGIRIGVLRHLWEEEDLRVHPAVPAALDRAIDVLRELGAEVASARIRPLVDYYTVKNVITKAEVFCVHQQDLAQRPDDFGPDFLGMTLGGGLFEAVDYVQAQRERTLMMREMSDLHRRFDVLLAPNAGPAPILAGKSPLDLWQTSTAPSSWCIPFSIAGGPALSLCVGFTDDGLPLGMQIAARPGADALLLQVGHAFEAATKWHKARPKLEAGSRVPSDVLKEAQSAAEVPDTELAWLSWHAHRAGIDTDEGRGAMLAAAHPIVQAMAERLRRPRPWQVESPNVFDASKDVT